VHHARATLRRSGYRLTPQRTAIWEVLLERRSHMTADEIADAVRERIPEVNTSTVYRTLELLVSLDLITETKLGSNRGYFEVSPDPSHHHFVCESCGAVGHFGDTALTSLYEALASAEDFSARHAHATVFGLCGACREDGMARGDADAHT
jgi:Fur family ferric uptake transcriptional regulator